MNTEAIIDYIESNVTESELEEIQIALTNKKLKSLGTQFRMERTLNMTLAHKLCAIAKTRYSLEELENRLGKKHEL